MTNDKKDLGEIGRLIASYGADAGRWPEAERERARALIVRNSESPATLKEANVVAEAVALDALLDSLPTPAPADAALIDRLMDIPGGETVVRIHDQGTQVRSEGLSETLWKLIRPQLFPQAAGILIAGVMGIMLGLSGVDRPSGPIAVFDASAYMFGDPGLARDLEDID